MFNFHFSARHENPFWECMKMKGKKTQDFEFLNRDTVIATTGVKQLHLSIFDVLLPQNRNLIADMNSIGGTKIATLTSNQQLLCFNGNKNGLMQIFDI